MKTPLKALTLLLATLALGLKPSRPAEGAAGNCLYECEGSLCADFGNKSDLCQTTRAKCEARCQGRRWWGAIAYNKNDKAWGGSWGWNEAAAAKKRALDRCSARSGAGCQVWAFFENECGAVAADGSIVTWGTASLKATAQQRAVLECKKAGGKNCTVQAAVCSKMMEVGDAY